MKRADMKKAVMWRTRIREAARSGLSIREFCRRRNVKESQFYWWQRRLKEKRLAGAGGATESRASFALVSEEGGALEAGLELVLGDGRRLRIGRGVDEATLRAVLVAVEPSGC